MGTLPDILADQNATRPERAAALKRWVKKLPKATDDFVEARDRFCEKLIATGADRELLGDCVDTAAATWELAASSWQVNRLMPSLTDDRDWLDFRKARNTLRHIREKITMLNPAGLEPYLRWEGLWHVFVQRLCTAPRERREGVFADRRKHLAERLERLATLPRDRPAGWTGDLPAEIPKTLADLRDYVAKGLDLSWRGDEELRLYALDAARDVLLNAFLLLNKSTIVPRLTMSQGIKTNPAEVVPCELSRLLNWLDERLAEGRKPAGNGQSPSGAITAGGSTMSVRDLASKHDVDREQLRKRLDTWRKSHDEGCSEITNRKRNGPQYLYNEQLVLPVIERLKSRKTSGKRPARKKST